MIKTVTLIAILLTSLIVNSQTIYSKAYGNSKNKALIFLHGGPGYNSVVFESTTAQKLSESGFYVITYDRRGEGRSLEKNTHFTFNQTFDDLNLIFEKFKLKSATLIGHSFGGVIASLYAEKYPEKTESIVLVGTPVSMQETLSTIVKSSKKIYQNKKDSTNLNYINMLEQMDKSSLEYSSYCFSHAMQNGFYFPKKPSTEALNIYSKFKTDKILLEYSSQMTYDAPRGFWKNENYTTIDLTESLKRIHTKEIQIFGIYGKDDGLFSEENINKIKKKIGENNFEYLNNCSHNVFIDQQNSFINILKKWVK
jgi:proline iminopeptidase